MALLPSIAATSSRGGNAWPALLAGAVEAALASYLALDPDSPRLIQPLAGKTIALELTPFDWTLYLCPGDGSVQVLQQWLGPVDVTLRGSPAAFARLGLSEDSQGELFAGQVAVSGDMSAARNFQRLFDKLDIDWEEHLSHLTGDMAANRLGGLFRAGRQWLAETHRTFRLNLAEYLQEESRDLPAPLEADGFCRDVDGVRADVDRLEARIARLRAALAGD